MSDQVENETPEVKIERVEGAAQPVAEDTGNLGEEFREFGRQMVQAIRSVATSDELRHLGQQVVETIRDLGNEIQDTFERTKEKEEVKAVGEQAKRVTQSVSSNIRSGEATGDIQSSLSQALRTLNTELNKVIDQIQSRSAHISDEVEGTATEAKETAERVESGFDAALDETQGAKEGAQGIQDAFNETVNNDETLGGKN